MKIPKEEQVAHLQEIYRTNNTPSPNKKCNNPKRHCLKQMKISRNNSQKERLTLTYYKNNHQAINKCLVKNQVEKSSTLMSRLQAKKSRIMYFSTQQIRWQT